VGGRRLSIVVAAAALIGGAAAPAWAQIDEASPAGRDPALGVRWSFKGTGVFAEPSRAGLWRTRVEPSLRMGPRVTFDLAYEHRLRFTRGSDDAAGGGLGVLPAEARPPYRLRPLDWAIHEADDLAWRHEIDRAVLHAQVSRLEVSAGRQAIGWGRGVLFGALDLFAPFTPFEADREWRRGADAVRVEGRLSSRTSADVVLAFDERAASSAYAGRLRGYSRMADIEVVGGRRARDTFGGATSSFAIGPAELHVEAAVFRTPAAAASALFGAPRTVAKVVAGGSSRLGIGGGLLLHVEYHYSGFGADGARAIGPAMQDPEFRRRVLRGDTQILTRHALAVIVSCEWSPLVAWSAALVQEPADGSGVATPTLTLTFSDRWSFVASGYLAYGRGADGPVPRSAYGSAPHTALVQLRFYGDLISTR
jgi:hypothetical protein